MSHACVACEQRHSISRWERIWHEHQTPNTVTPWTGAGPGTGNSASAWAIARAISAMRSNAAGFANLHGVRSSSVCVWVRVRMLFGGLGREGRGHDCREERRDCTIRLVSKMPVNVNVHKRRVRFSDTTRNPEGVVWPRLTTASDPIGAQGPAPNHSPSSQDPPPPPPPPPTKPHARPN